MLHLHRRTFSILLQLRNCYNFALYKDNKSQYANKQYDFEEMQKQKVKEYFQQYRKQVEKDTVVRDFRKQILNKNSKQQAFQKIDQTFSNQQKQLDKLLHLGTRESIGKYSKKIMQHAMNNKKMFKDQSNKSVFRDYAEYSAYKNNYMSIQDRNYANMDNLQQSNYQKNTYAFVDSLPQNYSQKSQARRSMQGLYPARSQDMTISQFGQELQKKHSQALRESVAIHQKEHEQWFKCKLQQSDVQNMHYFKKSAMIDVQTFRPFQTGMLSTRAMNTIYDLYLQGWSVREISKRYGILPARAKFIIWNRARLYTEALPKYGVQFLHYAMSAEQKAMAKNRVMDYGLDLQKMRSMDRYDQITVWSNHHVDAQRRPEEYTEALRKIQGSKKFTREDFLQVGTHGTENKKYLLKEWKIHRGKKSMEYFMKNTVFKALQHEKRKTKKVYY